MLTTWIGNSFLIFFLNKIHSTVPCSAVPYDTIIHGQVSSGGTGIFS